ncbi:alpha/beta fold hydrolase [Cytophagaceae bacterium ABcell3]|nr:alpha/beta fold hydrolase [Cytophagaceae bacterium ABcell3]
MPVNYQPGYQSPAYLYTGHLQTILPALFRRVGNVHYRRERIVTDDNDFLDLDWSTPNNSNHLVIISHGLEGDSCRPYVLGMVRALNLKGSDVLAWNYRGCSGEANKQIRSYHSGFTSDLHYVIQHVLAKQQYDSLYLLGFSVGGNITLKYLGEQKFTIPSEVRCAVNFSVPCNLETTAYHLARFRSKIYMQRFIKSLTSKLKEKDKLFPGTLDLSKLGAIKNFYQFDSQYTAPMFGYKSAKAYWQENSSIHYIKNITLPTLIVSAANDPFLTKECFPISEAEKKSNILLEIPATGGHCGFYEANSEGIYWSEKRAIEFIGNYI